MVLAVVVVAVGVWVVAVDRLSVSKVLILCDIIKVDCWEDESQLGPRGGRRELSCPRLSFFRSSLGDRRRRERACTKLN